ncbi:Fibrinogen-like protein A,Ryncolin-4,Angiopoietin-related protein 7,Angiopoietin-related protein 1,Ficolin-3,Ficolin-1-B,Techylectin-5A,Ficolin-2,Ryncolin-1,Tenascin-R,Fibrinogen-like protein 1,Angiopoietin-1,Ficolin-1,Ryncolin-3,Fibroleukin,Ryncolin-2,Angiopoietin-related protein 2,Tenascin,Angiopoietin-4 [Mytilus coruscus]|uniref:Fibrinogen C-terminal domain-containing protein n=1 Tax=Mytilus coruscus TaxID=42192 RepID=A0A6J8EHJ3_MYTCO|nr:Fibrinogen-like protein A,Ryncolin-4,Angiopoietin-related protein 7,Angiopoietin-related protein 1,Ficolin-3,Ficolin-1-B,Techylectin-5A,Ficolin-2,Ryncolin-1,Tenascin-R,Fibrinogen-like protein 1,Angiopoietin-1,Ficolin-1,Ryncolin-3,Fibroleukin,Ryncolin-2,Angiopoietin-related protein 2,Tenascin,Angiopoietin-4 [Mytilus coruscus]
MPILRSFFFLVLLLFVEGAEKDEVKDSVANRREIYDETTDRRGLVEDLTNHKRESSDVDRTVDDLMHSLQASKGPKEVSRVIRMLKNDVQGICRPLDLETPRDCAELKKKHKKSAVYTIYPDNSTAMTVYCNMDDYDGGWTVLQRRQDKTNFYRTWAEYKKGFGNVEKSFWLGNNNIHILTKSGRYELRIDLSDWTGNKWYAIYKTFSVGNEATKYRLNIGGFSGNAKDGLAHHNGMKFSTKIKIMIRIQETVQS